MHKGLDSLSDKEKQTLRLLPQGYDAKSIAKAQGLSLHTVNERLRDARAKLGVNSSRAAARMLAEAEAPKNMGGKDNSLADKQIGGAPGEAADAHTPSPAKRTGLPFVWFSGGMLIMSLLIAAAVLSPSWVAPYLAPAAHLAQDSGAQYSSAATSASAEGSTAEAEATRWLKLQDEGRYAESYNAASAYLKSHVSSANFYTAMQMVRQQYGDVKSRKMMSDIITKSAPGLPDGEYEIIIYHTNFTNKPDQTETVALVHQNDGWKVIGYFFS